MTTAAAVQDSDQHPLDKGKARARPTERTPLLASPLSPTPSSSNPLSPALSPSPTDPESPTTHRRRLRTKLLTVFLLTLATTSAVALLLTTLAWSYAAEPARAAPDILLSRALVTRGPDSIDVLNVTSDGDIWVLVSARVGLDAGAAIGVAPDEADGLARTAWKTIGRWGIKRLDHVSVRLSPIDIVPPSSPETPLASVHLPPFHLPLTPDPPRGSHSALSWLTPLALPVRIRPSQNTSAWLAFARAAWADGHLAATARVPALHLRGGALGDATWRSALLRLDRASLALALRHKIPPLPGLPPAGSGAPLPALTDLVELQSFTVTSSPAALALSASARVLTPLPPALALTLPALPFTVHLPLLLSNGTNGTTHTALVPLAALTTPPTTLTPPHTPLPATGHLLPPTPHSTRALSALLSRFLAGRPAPLALRTPLLPALAPVPFALPAPVPRPRVLRDVALRGMRLRAAGTDVLASGRVCARVVLPRGVHVRIAVHGVLPDVLVFDGAVPQPDAPPDARSSNSNSDLESDLESRAGAPLPPPHPLPDPLPPRAFAHIRPDAWLNATSVRAPPRSRSSRGPRSGRRYSAALAAVGCEGDEEDGAGDRDQDGEDDGEDGDGEEEGEATLVGARFVDVPLVVLPGREREFSSFVGKVIFGSQGALAGVQGVAGVLVRVEGMPLRGGTHPGAGDEGGDGDGDGEDGDAGMRLEGLPFEGEVRIGKHGL